MPLLEVDEEASVSLTWSVDEDGTLRHNPSGMRVSPDKGVVVDGQEYRLSPQDIDLDRSSTLGTGSGGVVQAGVHKPTGMRVAIKTVKVDNKEKREQMLKEIRGLVLAAGCPYLVQWYAGFVGKDTGLVHVVVELMDKGSLADLRRRCAGPVPPERMSCIAAQVVRGLEHLQSRRLLHRDVKPENVLHNSLGQVKLTDFGISKDLTSTAGVAGSFVGTANYMSPERALGKAYCIGRTILFGQMFGALESWCSNWPMESTRTKPRISWTSTSASVPSPSPDWILRSFPQLSATLWRNA